MILHGFHMVLHGFHMIMIMIIVIIIIIISIILILIIIIIILYDFGGGSEFFKCPAFSRDHRVSEFLGTCYCSQKIETC